MSLTVRLHSVYQVSRMKVKAFNNDQDNRILIYQVPFCSTVLQHSCSKVAQLIHTAQRHRPSKSSRSQEKKNTEHTHTHTHTAFGGERDTRFSKRLNKIFKQRGKKKPKTGISFKENINQ